MLCLSWPRSQKGMSGKGMYDLDDRYGVTPLVDVHGVTPKLRASGTNSGPSDATRGLDIQEQIDHVERVIRGIGRASDN